MEEGPNEILISKSVFLSSPEVKEYDIDDFQNICWLSIKKLNLSHPAYFWFIFPYCPSGLAIEMKKENS